MGKIIYEKHGNSEFPFFRFDAKEIRQLESCLTRNWRNRQRYDLKKVRESAFIRFLEGECFKTLYLYWQVNRNDHILTLKDFSGAFQKAEKYLERIQKGFDPFVPRVGEDMSPPFCNFNADCRNLVNEIIPKFKKAIEMIESAIMHDKRKQGGQITFKSEFAKRVAHIFQLCLGKPSMAEDGPFMEVMRIALDSIGEKTEYPTRAVRRALKVVQES